MAMKMISVTDIGDFKLGNAENKEKGTGCTVILCEEGAVGGVDVRGGGPATRETDLLRSENTVNAVNAVVLSGGSAFGLEAASGVMRELAERKVGFDVGDNIIVPIVCGASLYDLPVGDPKAFPDVSMGIEAVHNAYEGSFAKGNHGAGTGATVGKMKGYGRAMKTGLGAFACGDGVIEVGAIAAVNAVGDIYSGAGKIIAGLRSEDGKSIYGTIKALKSMVHESPNLTDESTSFINKSEIDEALAAAAKQYEEEKAAALVEEEQVPEEEPVEEIPEEPIVEETAEEICEESVAEEPEEEIYEEPAAEETVEEAYEEPAAEEPTEEIYEEHVAEESEEEFVEEPAEEEPAEEIFEESVEEEAKEEFYEEPSAEEPEEEFIPETPSAADFEDRMGYEEISIPVIAAEPAADFVEEPAEETPEEYEIFEPLVEETAEEQQEEIIEELADEFEEASSEVSDAFEALEKEYAEEPESFEAYEEPESFESQEESFTEEPFEEIIEEQPAEIIEEQAEATVDEAVIFEVPEENLISEPEVFESPEEEIAEEIAEEIVEEPAEEEGPVVLSREEMGYDIVFNTTISCLITNAALTKSQANKLASILHDAYARAIKPVHGTLDGDTVFVLATGKQQVNFDAFAALATDVMQYAIIDGALSAESAYGLPSARDIK